MKDIDNYIVGKVIQLLQVDEFSQAVARLGGSARYLISLSYEREILKGLFLVCMGPFKRYVTLQGGVGNSKV